MFNSSSRFIRSLLIIVLCALVPIGFVAAQEGTAPPPPVTLPEGHTYFNPHPGIVAPDTTESGFGTRAVTGSRGYGDAFFGWFLNNVSGYAGTWLDNGTPGTHYVCARVRDMIVDGSSVGSHSTPVCYNISPGISVLDSITNYVACGSSVVAKTEHSIQQTGYSWGPKADQDSIPSFCN